MYVYIYIYLIVLFIYCLDHSGLGIISICAGITPPFLTIGSKRSTFRKDPETKKEDVKFKAGRGSWSHVIYLNI